MGREVACSPSRTHVSAFIAASGSIVHGNALFEVAQIEKTGQTLFSAQLHFNLLPGAENTLVHIGVYEKDFGKLTAVGVVGY